MRENEQILKRLMQEGGIDRKNRLNMQYKEVHDGHLAYKSKDKWAPVDRHNFKTAFRYARKQVSRYRSVEVMSIFDLRREKDDTYCINVSCVSKSFRVEIIG